MKKQPYPEQLSFDFNTRDTVWPAQELFPLNLAGDGRTVEEIIEKDIKNSTRYLIVTGFTSLSKLVDTFGSRDLSHLKKVEIALGFEPNIKGRKRYNKHTFEKEIKDFWLEEGFSILHGGAVINLIEKIKKGWIVFRYRDKNHSKLYVGDAAAILGSSNFSKNGLSLQEEANIRIKDSKQKQRKEQYEGIRQIATNYYEGSIPYNDKIIELLKGIIRKVTWQEALARAITELLEGEWLNECNELTDYLNRANLWPTQRIAVGQALSMLQEQSTVLIADPTGAGKTRLCTAIYLALKYWLISRGEQLFPNLQVICPPLVCDKWDAEARAFGQNCPYPISSGLLSNSNLKNWNRIKDILDRLAILVIDEAHNYLTPGSNRTSLIRTNQAQFKLLITATPISKSINDIFQLIRLGDVDNLSDENFEKLQYLIQRRNIHHSPEAQALLKEFVRTILLRRPKSWLNKEIEKDPGSYLNYRGKPCKFPKQENQIYTTLETATDKAIVRQINQLAARLKGITFLLTFKKPSFELTQEEHIRQYIERRIISAPALSSYLLRSRLRSSHVALIEHIEGTQKAMELFGFQGKREATGNQLEKLKHIIQFNRLPRRNPMFKKEYFPVWLTDEKEYLKACRGEENIYKEISRLASQLSGEREAGKMKELIRIARKHRNILAFDSTVITLYYLKKLFEQQYPEQKLLVATGSEKAADSRKVMEAFDLRSTDRNHYIALCSDKMSESVDLQQASAVVLLDMPSVLRIVEQRIGRADRMDSPHKQIEIYWPNDSKEYALRSDSRLIATNELVETLYGSNIEIPADLREKHFTRTNSVSELIEEYQDFVENEEKWMGIEDNFQPVIKLKEGPSALIPETLYEEMKEVTARIRTRVSFIEAQNSWCFLALKGTSYQAPRWYLIDHTGTIHTELPPICNKLREYLTGEVNELPWNEPSLDHFINLFREKEKDLLPHKKRRSLDVMEQILTKKKTQKDLDRDTKQLIGEVLPLFSNRNKENPVEFDELASRCIRILQPYLHAKNQASRKNILLNLNSLRNDHKKINLTPQQLTTLLNTPTKTDPDKQIIACIVGVSGYH